jgi:hypothetical protein
VRPAQKHGFVAVPWTANGFTQLHRQVQATWGTTEKVLILRCPAPGKIWNLMGKLACQQALLWRRASKDEGFRAAILVLRGSPGLSKAVTIPPFKSKAGGAPLDEDRGESPARVERLASGHRGADQKRCVNVVAWTGRVGRVAIGVGRKGEQLKPAVDPDGRVPKS